MATIEIVMPKMGESVMEAVVLQWLKKEGDMIQEEEPIIEVGTDKVDSEVPSPYTGILQELLVQPGALVKIGAPLATIEVMEEAIEPKEPQLAFANETASQLSKPNFIHANPTPTKPLHTNALTDGRFYSPLVRHIAQQEDIEAQELSQLPGTGKGNRVTKRDLLAYLQYRPTKSTYVKASVAKAQVVITPEDEVIAMDRVRQMIAERMIVSKSVAAHVTSFVEADVTDLVVWRDSHKVDFEQKTNVRLTYTPLFLQAIIRAIQDFPMLNAFVVEDRIIKKKAINIGMAVALPDGNLVVPVIKNAAQLDLVALTNQVQTLAYKARHGGLSADELTDGTYTVSNLGSFHNLMGTPIIMQPQVAILALGAIVKKPVVVTASQEDSIAIRHMMYLSHSYDHRVIDGALGGGFVKQVAQYLETFASWVSW